MNYNKNVRHFYYDLRKCIPDDYDTVTLGSFEYI